MPAGPAILVLLLNLAALGLLVYWGVGLWRLVRTMRQIPTARAGVALAARHPPRGPVAVIIPAHNEEEAIRPLLESLKAQDYPELAVLLCLDRCTDGTAEVVRDVIGGGREGGRSVDQRGIGGDERFRIVEIGACPEEWAGKVNAAWTGANQPEARSADYILFADADTVFDRGCISATVALLEHRDLDLLSLLSTLTGERWFERVVQPAAGLELIRQYPITRANRLERRRAFANGQFMLFRREAYDAIGGHEAVCDELLEDIALSRRIADAGRPAGLVLADGMVRCRMYDTWEAFRSGWKRIYTESARCKVKRLKRAALVAVLMGAILPVAAAVNLVVSIVLLVLGHETVGMIGLVLSGLGLVVWHVVVGATYRISQLPLSSVPGFVLGSWLVGGILAEAARDLRAGKPIAWGGRTYIRQPR